MPWHCGNAAGGLQVDISFASVTLRSFERFRTIKEARQMRLYRDAVCALLEQSSSNAYSSRQTHSGKQMSGRIDTTRDVHGFGAPAG